MSSPPSRLTERAAQVRYFGHDHCIAWQGNVQFILSNEAPTLLAMTMMAKELEALAVACQRGIGCLLIIHSGVSPPDEEVRKFIRLKLERTALVAAGQVVLGTGFRGAAMRSMLSLLQVAMRPTFSMRIFGKTDEGVDWLVKQLEAKNLQSPSIVALKRTAAELCTRFFR